MSFLKRLLVALTVLVLAGLALGSSAGAAQADGSGDSVSWTVRTALSQYGSGRPKFSYTVKPGGELTDGIDIVNKGHRKIRLKVYAADGFTTGSGGYDVLTPDKPSKGVGAWVTPAVTVVTIPAGKQVQIPFALKVPKNATPGDHLGGIVTVLDQRDSSGSGTVVHRRVGLRIESHVSGEVTSRLEVEKLKLDYDGHNPFGTGRATISYTVHNVGNTALSGIQKVEVAGGLGLSSRTVSPARLPNLLPGESWDAKVAVDDVRAMLWVTATATVTPVATDAAGSSTTLAPVEASTRTVVSAWSFVLLAGFVGALVAVVWLAVVLVKGARRRSRAKVDAQVAAAVEEALSKEDALR